jgi:hypothetical protein
MGGIKWLEMRNPGRWRGYYHHVGYSDKKKSRGWFVNSVYSALVI